MIHLHFYILFHITFLHCTHLSIKLLTHPTNPKNGLIQTSKHHHITNRTTTTTPQFEHKFEPPYKFKPPPPLNSNNITISTTSPPPRNSNNPSHHHPATLNLSNLQKFGFLVTRRLLLYMLFIVLTIFKLHFSD